MALEGLVRFQRNVSYEIKVELKHLTESSRSFLVCRLCLLQGDQAATETLPKDGCDLGCCVLSHEFQLKGFHRVQCVTAETMQTYVTQHIVLTSYWNKFIDD